MRPLREYFERKEQPDEPVAPTQESYGVEANRGAMDEMGGAWPEAVHNHFEQRRDNPRIGWNGSGAPGANLIALHQQKQAQYGLGPMAGMMDPNQAISAAPLGERAGSPAGPWKPPGVNDGKDHCPLHLRAPRYATPEPPPLMSDTEVKAAATKFAAALRGNPAAAKVINLLAQRVREWGEMMTECLARSRITRARRSMICGAA